MLKPGVFVLGVGGKAGSGKDTVCDYLVSEFGFQKIALATPLKKIVAEVFPKFPSDHLYGSSPLRSVPCSEYPLSGNCPMCGRRMAFVDLQTWECRCGFQHGAFLTPRLALQTLGTEWGRRLYPNVWVDYAFSQIEQMSGDRFCISDVRFQNEVEGIRKNGGAILRILRGRAAEPKRKSFVTAIAEWAYGPQNKDHASETGLDLLSEGTFLSTIRNDSTIPDLFSRVTEVISEQLR